MSRMYKMSETLMQVPRSGLLRSQKSYQAALHSVTARLVSCTLGLIGGK